MLVLYTPGQVKVIGNKTCVNNKCFWILNSLKFYKTETVGQHDPINIYA